MTTFSYLASNLFVIWQLSQLRRLFEIFFLT